MAGDRVFVSSDSGVVAFRTSNGHAIEHVPSVLRPLVSGTPSATDLLSFGDGEKPRSFFDVDAEQVVRVPAGWTPAPGSTASGRTALVEDETDDSRFALLRADGSLLKLAAFDETTVGFDTCDEYVYTVAGGGVTVT